MRFLHTGDWHIGKPIKAQRRDDEYANVLAEISDVARREQVDAILVAGDLFDTASPSAEAERLVYEFFTELRGHHIPAVVIGGNHDHPRRLEAVRPLLQLADVHLRGMAATADTGGIVTLPSRDGKESATVAVLPWVPEGTILGFDDILAGDGQPYQSYADRVAAMVDYLGKRFRAETVNVLLAHLFVDGSYVGREGGERPIHLGQAFAITPQKLPANAQYAALGHIHRGQQVGGPCPTYYSGSPMQLDFGEAGQEKSVVIVEARVGLPAKIERIPITSGRALRDVEGQLAELPKLVAEVGNDFLRVRVHVDEPVLNLAERVREILPNAVEVTRVRAIEDAPQSDTRLSLGPEDLLREFYRVEMGAEASDGVVALFNRLYGEEYRETDPA
jgi:exonuclease SbcD